MPTDYFWMVNKMFYDPPGTPKNLRCISCKYAAGAGLLALSGASVFGCTRAMKKNAYVGALFAFASFCFGSASAIAVRMAVDDQNWNELQIKLRQEELSRYRRQKAAELNPKTTQTVAS